MAHELRSPLTSVKGFSSTLLRRWERFTDDQKRLMIETIEADADRVTRLITELLDVSRLDAGRLAIQAPAGRPRAIFAQHVERSGRQRPPRGSGSPSTSPTTCPRCGPTPTGSTRSWPT